MGKYYVVDQAYEHQIKTYKYSGADNSLYYKFVLTPLNNFLMDNCVPLWIAPNVITLIGFICCVLAFILSSVYSPTFSETLPPFVPLFCGLAFFVYQTLDNLDGKQARKTGSSSALGLLFDHGCDVNGLTLAYLAAATFLYTGRTLNFVLFYLNGVIAFGFATWEHYHTGTLQMGIINGPSDGEAIMYFAAVVEALRGPRYLEQTFKQFLGFGLPSPFSHLDDYPLLWIIVGITGPGLILTVLDNTRNVLMAQAKKNASLLYPLGTIMPFLSVWTITGLWAYFEPQIIQNHPRIFILSSGAAMSITAIRLMLTHICHAPYNIPAGLIFVSPWISAGLNAMYFHVIPSQDGLFAAFFTSVSILVLYVVLLVDDMRRLLNIQVFSIPLVKKSS